MLLRAIRQDCGLTQKQLSVMTGISQPNISDIENARVNPTIHTASKLAAALGCTIDELMSGPRLTLSIQQERT